jgi:periplasmic copper chaperone A
VTPRTCRLAALLTTALLAGCGSGGGVHVEGAWVSAGPPSQTAAAAYLVIENRSDRKVVLRGAETPMAGAVEIHETVRAGDVMRMRRVEGLEIPARTRVELKPGGTHLMLLGLKEMPREGTEVEIALHFEGAAGQTVDAAVKRYIPR